MALIHVLQIMLLFMPE